MSQVQITIRDHEEEELLRQAREKIGGRCPATEAEFIETAVRQRIGVVLEEAGASEDPEGDGDIEFDDSETADDYYMAGGPALAPKTIRLFGAARPGDRPGAGFSA